MRLSIVVAITAALLLKLKAVPPVEAVARQQQQQQQRSYFQSAWPQWHSYGSSSLKEQARSADATVGADKADQDGADTGRGFIAKLKSMFQPTHSPDTAPVNAPTTIPTTVTIILPTSPSATLPTSPAVLLPTTPTITTPTTTTITTPTTPTTATITAPTTVASRTQIVYGRQDSDEGAAADKQKGIIESTKPSMTNQTPLIGQLPRPQRRIHRGQLNRNKRRRRLQNQRITPTSNRNRNKSTKRRREQLQTAVGDEPLQQTNQRRRVVKVPNRNRIANRNDNFGANINSKVDIVNIGGNSADNNLDRNSRLQNFMNALRRPQTPIVFNH